MTMQQGTIVEATLIAERSSTKNKEAKRDPEMHQTNKGNQWYFGMLPQAREAVGPRRCGQELGPNPLSGRHRRLRA
jgi:hypothetical protein